MFENLEILRMASSMARHAALSQSVISQNVANADTPNYRSRNVASFADIYAAGRGTEAKDTAPQSVATRRASSVDTDTTAEIPITEDEATMSPNGNSVSLEDEMIKSVDVRRAQNLSLTIYKTTVSLLRSSIGGRA